MQGVKTYILILLTFLVVRKSLEDDADYTDFPSPPSTDWAKANPDRTTFPLVFPPKTTKSDDYDDYQGDAGYSSEQPRIVLAQGVYVMIMIPGYNDCGLFNVYEISSFRIGPLERTFSPPTDAVHAYAYCDWLEMNCNPPMGQTDEYDDYEEYDEAYFANQTTPATKPPPPKKVAGKGEGADETTIKAGENASTDSSTTTTQIPLLDLSSTWAPEMWLENATEPKPDVLIDNTELWLIAVAVLIILVSLLIPLAFWLGTRSGYNEAERYWSELSSTGGNVNISLGYVGTEWTRPVNAPK